MNSIADSRVSGRGGVSRSDSSWEWVRMLVSFFSLVALTSMSPGRRVLADDHALVDVDAGADEQLGALLEVEQAVGVGRPGPVGDEDAGRPMGHLAGPRAVALADLVHQGRAAGLGQELAAVADEAADRQDELHPDAAVGVGASSARGAPCGRPARAGPRR